MKLHSSPIDFILNLLHCLIFFSLFFALFAGMGTQSIYDRWAFISLALLLIPSLLLAPLTLRRISFLPLYLLIGILLSGGCGALAYSMGDLFADSHLIAACILSISSLALFLSYSSSKLKYGRIKEAFLEAHSGDADFEIRYWEVTTFFSKPQPYHWILFVLLYLIGLIVKSPFAWHYCFYATAIDFFLVFAASYRLQFQNFLLLQHRVSNLPVVAMKRMQKGLLWIGLVLMLVCILPALLYNREPLVNGIDIHIDYQAPDNTLEGPSQDDLTDNMNTNMLDVVDQSLEGYQAPAWISALVKVFAFLLLIATGLMVLYGIISWILHLIRNFTVEDGDEVILLDDDTEDKIFAEGKKKTSKKDGYLSPTMRLRRRYRKAIQKSTKGKPARWATPTELEKDAGLTEDPTMQALHPLYEKARYSQNGLTQADLNSLKD